MYTAEWIAAVRARESERVDRLFHDPFARTLAGQRGFTVMDMSEQASGGENRFIPVRVRWFDDLIVAAMRDGITQVVLLGAGFDTRPYRLPCPAGVNWFEVDRREVFDAKDEVLQGHVPSCRRHVVSADLAANWETPLLAAGFVEGMDTLWIAEGLFFYLTEQAVIGLLRISAGVCGAGSQFAADLIGTGGGLDPKWFTCSDPIALFNRGDWCAATAVRPGGPGANFGRLPAVPPGALPGSTHLALATGPRC